LTLLAMVLAAVIGAVLLTTADVAGLDRLQADVGSTKPALSALRLVFIVALMAAWPALLRVCQRRNWISAVTEQHLQAWRARLALWLIALELILGLEIFNRLYGLIAGLVA
jgi:hypothetical protein